MRILQNALSFMKIVYTFFVAIVLALPASAAKLQFAPVVMTPADKAVPYNSAAIALDPAFMLYPRQMDFLFSGTFGVSNCVEVAFGTDADGDGTLARQEEALAFGWRAGWYFLENRLTAERLYAPSGNNAAPLRLCFEYPLNAGFAARWHLTAAGEELFADCQTLGLWPLFDLAWTHLKVTVRGPTAFSESSPIKLEYLTTAILIR